MSLIEYIDRPALVDPLQDVLRLVEVRAERAARFTGHGDWAVRFSPPAGAKFNSVLTGSCMLQTEGMDCPVSLRAGDSFLLTRPQEFTLYTSPRTSPVPVSPYFQAGSGASAEVGPLDQPATARLVGGSFSFGRRARELLLDALPALIHLPAHAEGATMVPDLLSRIDRETNTQRLGSTLVTEHLAVVLLIDVMRYHLAHGPGGAGWLSGLGDPLVSAALQAVHTSPARRWTVQLLADAVHVSRSTLAARFKTAVGRGPLEYLTHWRLELGAHRLTTTDQTIAAVADAVGYGSEAAFALAFKRELGVTPGKYRKESRGRVAIA